ncbi:MAG: PP2C family serine/threonine-protein phosphatase, partial [Anaerolineales bacterium]
MTNNLISKLLNLFQKKSTPGLDLQDTDPNATTKELDKITAPVDTKLVGYSSPHISVGYGLSVGKQRTHNEDAFFTLTTMFSYNETELPFGLYVIADGMGGHKNGEIASELAIRTLVGCILTEIYTPLMSLDPEQGELSFREVFHAGIEK